MAVRMLDAETLVILASTPVEGRTPVTVDTMKDWARRNGYAVNDGPKGRQPMATVNAYNSAHKTKQYITGSEVQEPVTYEYEDSTGRKRKFKEQPKVVRAWAKAEGLTVGERGRFSQEVRNAYGRHLKGN